MITKYALENISNTDETGLFFKVLSEKTLAFKGDVFNGRKRAKQRLMILLGANMTDLEKILLPFIRKYITCRCFRNLKMFPSAYFTNKKLWMTGEIHEKWLKELDQN